MYGAREAHNLAGRVRLPAPQHGMNTFETQESRLQPDGEQPKLEKEARIGLLDLFTKNHNGEFLFMTMLKDEKVKESLKAAVRTLANVGITLVDFIPGIGDVVSLGADLLKWTKFDITPDVSKEIAVGSEALEPFFGGALPTHAIEGGLQLWKDVPRLKEGMQRAKEIWTAHKNAVNSPEVTQAAAVFAQPDNS